MIVPGATLGQQLLLDTFAPLLIVLIFRINRFNERPLLEDDPSFPRWVRNLWKYLLGALYVWFLSATLWHFGFSATH
jgi:multisubunit Na+/H+ antiporter MnhB subunit